MIELRALSVSFGPVRALHQITMSLEAPVTGVIGPNGAGKTTLLNAIAGTVSSTGSAVVDGVDIADLQAYERARHGVRRTFQTDQVMLGLTVLDNVRVGSDTLPRPDRHAAHQHAVELLEMLGMDAAQGRLGRSLTNIERRKVEIARALVGHPRVLLMDEPGAGLLGEEKAELEAVIERIPVDAGTQVIVIEHDIELVARVCGAAIVLDFGQLIAEGKPDDVLAASNVRAAYLGMTEDAP